MVHVLASSGIAVSDDATHDEAMEQWMKLSAGIRWVTAQDLILEFDIPAADLMDLSKEEGEDMLKLMRADRCAGVLADSKCWRPLPVLRHRRRSTLIRLLPMHTRPRRCQHCPPCATSHVHALCLWLSRRPNMPCQTAWVMV